MYCIYIYIVVYGVNAPRRAWFFPRLCSLAVYVFNALADCKMTLPKTRCPTLLGSFTTYIYQNACFYIHVCLHVYIYICVCKGYLKYLCIHVSSRCCGIAKVFFGILTSCSKRQNIIDHKHKILQITV